MRARQIFLSCWPDAVQRLPVSAGLPAGSDPDLPASPIRIRICGSGRWCAVAGVLRLRQSAVHPAFGAVDPDQLAGRAGFARTKMRCDHHGGDRRQSRRARRCSNTPTSLPSISGWCSAGRCRCSISRCRSASRSSPSITSCTWSICARERRRSIRSTATRSTSRSSRRRSPGPLARWSEVMEQFGRKVYAPGWQRQFCARHRLHR